MPDHFLSSYVAWLEAPYSGPVIIVLISMIVAAYLAGLSFLVWPL